MDEATRAYLFKLGNPYAKLSILDDKELAALSTVAQPSRAKRRASKSDVDATRAYLFKLEDPYAKLSIIPQEELRFAPAEPQAAISLLWKTRTDVYEYVSEAFALPLFRTRPPVLLKQFGEKVIRLSPRAQNALYHRIAAHLPDEKVAYNRLPPKELDQLLNKLVEMADDAAALDGQTD
jgi:hypothetical protein